MASAGCVQTLLTCAKAQERHAVLPDGFFHKLFPAGHETTGDVVSSTDQIFHVRPADSSNKHFHYKNWAMFTLLQQSVNWVIDYIISY